MPDDKDYDELAQRVGTDMKSVRPRGVANDESVEAPDSPDAQGGSKFRQWSSSDRKVFRPISATSKCLDPGMYEIQSNHEIGLFFLMVDVSTEDLVRFEDSNSDELLEDITKFWSREELFRVYNLPYKRGILMWGAPGTGKTCTIRLVMEDVIRREGIVVKFTDPRLFVPGMRVLREIQGDTPVVVIMEDLDELCSVHGEASITDILDGTERVDKIVFLATTNYPEHLSARIVNRPSRFDRILKIGNLGEKNRRIYMEHLCSKAAKKGRELDLDYDKWVKDTEALSVSHIKELFISSIILGNEYDEVISRLRAMRDKLESQESVGFNTPGTMNRR